MTARPDRTLLLFLAATAGGTALAATRLPLASALLVGFDMAALLLLLVLARRFSVEAPDRLRARALPGGGGAMSITTLAVLVAVLVALVSQLAGLASRGGDIAIAAATLSLVWLTGNAVMTQYYAGHWYRHERSGGGLRFAGHGDTALPPDGWDFAYVSFTIAMSFQAGDVAVTSPGLRRIVLVHAMVAFLYNMGVVALTVSLLTAALAG